MIFVWILIGSCVLAALVSIIYTVVSLARSKKEDEEYFNKEKLLHYEQQLAELLKKKKLDDSNDIRKIAEKINYKIEETDDLRFYEEARFYKDQKIIKVRKDFDMMQQNFDIAHELTHILRGDKESAKTAISFFKRKSIDEQITDYMAAAILIPADELVEAMKKSDYQSMKKEERARFRERVSLDKNVHRSVVNRRVDEVIKMGKYPKVKC